MSSKTFLWTCVAGAALLLLINCGGGGGSSSTTTTTQPVTTAMSIASTSLPVAVQGLTYSTTLSETNGTAPFTWSVDTTSPNQLPGLAINAASGAISGTPTVTGSFNILFKVTDSSKVPQTAEQYLTLIIEPPLSFQLYGLSSISQYQSQSQNLGSANGGAGPYVFSVVQGTLPPGIHVVSSNGYLSGAATTVGTYSFTIQVEDSYSPPEIVTQPVTLAVIPPPLQITNSFSGLRMFLSKPFTGSFVATGGTPPYSFSITFGGLPTGVSLTNSSTGAVSGTPTVSGSFNFTLAVTDAASTTVFAYPSVAVTPSLGRNDSPSSATRIGNGNANASISPLLDSTGTIAPDTDYYKLVAAAGSTVHVATYAKQGNPNDPLDTVIEITDINGIRFTTGCNPPGTTSTTFSSPCLNDDISANPHVQDSALDYKVPGTSGTQTFLVHVLDWSGTARPDMIYTLSVSGVLEPLTFNGNLPWGGVIGTPYSQTLYAGGGLGTITYSIASGALPPGLALAANGTITGTPTTAGKYSFTAQASDQSTPPQVVTRLMTIGIATPLSITTTSVPSGTLGVPYSFPLTSTGGLGPINWVCYDVWGGITVSPSGVLAGTPALSGSHTFTVTAHDTGADPGGQSVSGSLTLTVP